MQNKNVRSKYNYSNKSMKNYNSYRSLLRAVHNRPSFTLNKSSNSTVTMTCSTSMMGEKSQASSVCEKDR